MASSDSSYRSSLEIQSYLHIGCRNPAGWLDKWAGSPLPEPLHKSINCSEAYTACPFATIHIEQKILCWVFTGSAQLWCLSFLLLGLGTPDQQKYCYSAVDRQNWPDRILQCLPPSSSSPYTRSPPSSSSSHIWLQPYPDYIEACVHVLSWRKITTKKARNLMKIPQKSDW